MRCHICTPFIDRDGLQQIFTAREVRRQDHFAGKFPFLIHLDALLHYNSIIYLKGTAGSTGGIKITRNFIRRQDLQGYVNSLLSAFK